MSIPVSFSICCIFAKVDHFNKYIQPTKNTVCKPQDRKVWSYLWRYSIEQLSKGLDFIQKSGLLLNELIQLTKTVDGWLQSKNVRSYLLNSFDEQLLGYNCQNSY